MKILRNLQGFKPQSLLITSTIMGSFYVNAQNKFDEIYNSDVFIEEGVKLFDAKKYTESIIEYDKVSKTDIDYLKAQYEKAYSLLTLEKHEELEKMLKEMQQSGEIKKFPSLYIIYGNLLSTLNRFEESEKIYKEGAELIPNSNGLLFNTGIMYVRSEQNQKAIEVFKNLVEVNPNNASAHYILGILAFDDGQIVEGSLAMLAYLMIDPDGKHAQDAIIHLNSKFGGVYKSNPQLSFSAQGDDFSELEMILKNELPLSNKYKLKASIDDIYPRQLQAIMEYLPTHPSKGGFFEIYYLPWLIEISKRNFTEAFTYYSLSSYQEQLGKALSSEKKKVEKFTTDFISKDFWTLYAKRNRMHFGKKEDVVVYLKDGLPYSQGKMVNGKNEGKFLFFDTDGRTLSELNYLNDELDKSQIYYYPNLNKSDEITYANGKKNGPFKSYYWNGTLRLEGNYVNDQYDGNFKSYHPTGGVYCEFQYANGNQTGKNLCLWPNGKKNSEHNFVNSQLEGHGIVYNEAGDKKAEFNFSKGMYHGKGTTYFDGQQIKTTSEYKEDKQSNDFLEYYADNQLRREEKYQNGLIQSQKFLNPIGAIVSETIYDAKGKIQEYRNYSHNGKLYLTEKHKNEELNTVVLHFPSPKEMDLKNTLLEIKNDEGIVVASGKYVNKKMDGEWKYFYENGELSYKKTFKEGLGNGLYYDYKNGGDLNFIQNLLENNSHGLYESYEHDKIYLQSYHEKDLLSGPYQYFRPNGKIELEGFYVEDEKNYFQYEYYLEGEIKNQKTYVFDFLVHEKQFDKKGNLLFEFDYTNKTGKYELKTPSNQTLKSVELVNGIANGLLVKQHLDGAKEYEVNYENDKMHGPYKRFHPNGVVSIEGGYYAHSVHGKFTYYDQLGNIRLTTHYLFGRENGNSISYYPNGKTLISGQNKDDKEHGEKIYFNMAGKPVVSIEYYLNKPVSYKVLNAEGNLGESKTIELGNVSIQSTYPNGKLAFQANYVKGLREGIWEIKEESGAAAYSAPYSKDKLNGVRVIYHENGKIFKKENFAKGDYHGLIEIFEANGQPAISMEYYYDDLNGATKIYKNGKLEKTKIYDTDEIVEVF